MPAALVLAVCPTAASASIEFYFTSESVLRLGAAAATTEWQAQCLAGGEFADVASGSAPDAQMTADERRAQTGKFDRQAFVRIATDAWQKADAALPQGAVRVCVDLTPVADGFTRDVMRGVNAVTAGRGRIIVRVHPDADWRAALPYALAHELHHSYWAEHHYDVSKPFTLADYLVLEGRADYFAGSLFTHPAPWTTAVDDSSYPAVWSALAKRLGASESESLRAAMFGGQDGLPIWAGYSVGYRLVRERMARAPKLDLKAMSAAPAAEFMPPGR